MDIFRIEDDKIIINMTSFYDNLKLANIKQSEFNAEGRILVRRCIEECLKSFKKDKKVVLNDSTVELEFCSLDKFKEWLYSDSNKELGIEKINVQNKPFND